MSKASLCGTSAGGMPAYASPFIDPGFVFGCVPNADGSCTIAQACASSGSCSVPEDAFSSMVKSLPGNPCVQISSQDDLKPYAGFCSSLNGVDGSTWVPFASATSTCAGTGSDLREIKCFLTDPGTRFRARCCLGKTDLLPDGDAVRYCEYGVGCANSSVDCDKAVADYCSLPGNMDDPACAAACSVADPPGWCAVALRDHCSASGGLRMGTAVCQIACPIKWAQTRAPFCDDAAKALCASDNPAKYCSCVNPDYGTLPAVIDNYCLPPCADSGYQVGQPPASCPDVCLNIIECGDDCDIRAVNACKSTYGGGGSGLFGLKVGPLPAWVVALAGVVALVLLTAIVIRPRRP